MIVRYVMFLVLVLGCGGEQAASRSGGQAASESLAVAIESSHAPDSLAARPPDRLAAPRPRIVFLGTSLTAGYGLEPDAAYPAIIQAKLDSVGLNYQVMNAGVSGETSAGSLKKLDWILRDPVSVLVIETGANDGLRGQDPDSLRHNLEAIIDRARAQQPPPRILLVGMEALPNLGATYRRRFTEVYPQVARERNVPLIPFLLVGVAGVDSLNQADGIHPTVEGQRIVAGTVWKQLEPMLGR